MGVKVLVDVTMRVAFGVVRRWDLSSYCKKSKDVRVMMWV